MGTKSDMLSELDWSKHPHKVANLTSAIFAVVFEGCRSHGLLPSKTLTVSPTTAPSSPSPYLMSPSVVLNRTNRRKAVFILAVCSFVASGYELMSCDET